MTDSPYAGVPELGWLGVTRRLVRKHPLTTSEIVDVVLLSWQSIFASRMGTQGFQIGQEIFPKPQILGFFLHELIPLEFQARYPDAWRPEDKSSDKDIVYIPDNFYSIELKTSSNPRHIFGNRSYAQETSQTKKVKSGYYLAVNFEQVTKKNTRPKILQIRFGWLDSSDWIGQKAATGQQARLSLAVSNTKLLVLYPVKSKSSA